MGIPRKNSRQIAVYGREYRYVLRETSGGDPKELQVTVQEDVERPGRVLQWKWPHGHGYGPDDVRQSVELALGSGWNPSERGPAFTLNGT